MHGQTNIRFTLVVFADQKGLTLLIPKFATGCSFDPDSSTSHSYIPFRQNLPQNVVLLFIFAIFHVTISNYISQLDLELLPIYFVPSAQRAQPTATSYVTLFCHHTSASFLCYNIPNLLFFLRPFVFWHLQCVICLWSCHGASD